MLLQCCYSAFKAPVQCFDIIITATSQMERTQGRRHQDTTAHTRHTGEHGRGTTFRLLLSWGRALSSCRARHRLLPASRGLCAVPRICDRMKFKRGGNDKRKCRHATQPNPKTLLMVVPALPLSRDAPSALSPFAFFAFVPSSSLLFRFKAPSHVMLVFAL